MAMPFYGSQLLSGIGKSSDTMMKLGMLEAPVAL